MLNSLPKVMSKWRCQDSNPPMLTPSQAHLPSTTLPCPWAKWSVLHFPREAAEGLSN